MAYDVIAYITTDRNRVIGGSQLSLYAENEDQQKIIMQDIAKAMKADVTRLKNGDYLIFKL